VSKRDAAGLIGGGTTGRFVRYEQHTPQIPLGCTYSSASATSAASSTMSATLTLGCASSAWRAEKAPVDPAQAGTRIDRGCHLGSLRGSIEVVTCQLVASFGDGLLSLNLRALAHLRDDVRVDAQQRVYAVPERVGDFHD
jgi:hypothetical protein